MIVFLFMKSLAIYFFLIPIYVSVAMIVWFAKMSLGIGSKKRGPNVIQYYSHLFQTLADALKYIFKEIIILQVQIKLFLFLAPIITMTLAFRVAWAVIPMNARILFLYINVGILSSSCFFFTRSLWNYNGRMGL